MTARRALALALVATTIAIAGCGGQGGDSSGSTASGSGLRGILRDETGRAQGNAEVLACMATVCQFGTTDGGGRFNFSIDPPAEVALKTREDLSADPPRGAALYPVRLVDKTTVDLDDVHIPSLPAGSPLGEPEEDPQSLAAGDGLELTLRRADLVANGHGLTEVAARSIPPGRMPELEELRGEKIEKIFALHPFSVTSRSPIAVKVASPLPPGTKVQLRTISEINGRLSEPVGGTADGSFVTTAPGTGIMELTWLVLSTRS